MRWEGQVEKALRSPWADSILTAAVREDQEEGEAAAATPMAQRRPGAHGRLHRPGA